MFPQVAVATSKHAGVTRHYKFNVRIYTPLVLSYVYLKFELIGLKFADKTEKCHEIVPHEKHGDR